MAGAVTPCTQAATLCTQNATLCTQAATPCTQVKLLLKKGAALAARYGAQQRTPLHMAAARGDFKLVQLILELDGGAAGTESGVVPPPFPS